MSLAYMFLASLSAVPLTLAVVQISPLVQYGKRLVAPKSSSKGAAADSSNSTSSEPACATDPKQEIATVLTRFLAGLRFSTPQVATERRAELLEALLADCRRYLALEPSVQLSPAYVKICQHSVAMAELSYHRHSFEEQLQVARFTWFMIYIDDLAGSIPELLVNFQAKLTRGEPHDNPVLHYFSLHLSDFFTLYEGLPANSILAATFEFVTGCVLETRDEINKMPIVASAASWPYYLRTKTGVAQAYAFMIFAKSANPDIGTFYSVIPDISLFIDLTNDVLSFYKEEMAGEANNYIHNLSKVRSAKSHDTLRSVAADASAAHDRVTDTLRAMDSKAALSSWTTFVQGYVAFHTTQDRYRLRELLS